jgi:hypothetical protein
MLELLTSLVGLATALTTLILVFQSRKKIKAVDQKVEEVHELTNSQLTTVLDRVTLLTKTLQDAGVRIPETQSKD